jgi:hypothetical protein
MLLIQYIYTLYTLLMRVIINIEYLLMLIAPEAQL